jgi:pimeloyl-ACP methyl ester carboxylesterase
MASVRYGTADVDGLGISYREAGPADGIKLLLLHGSPSASHMFRDLIPLLADRFHIVAPVLPGLGESNAPLRAKFRYTLDNIACLIERFTEVVGFDRFVVYVFDDGAPTGFRLAVRHPERIRAIISQNGNIALYSTFQQYFRTHKPPFLAVWGKNDSLLPPTGADALERDAPSASVSLLDTGHIASETHCCEIVKAIGDFLDAI